MKIRNILSIMRLQFFVFAIVSFLVSCSKDNNEDVRNEDAASLIVSVEGVNPTADKVKLAVSAAKGNMVGLEVNDYIGKKTSKSGRLRMDFITDQEALGLDLDQSILDNGLVKQAGNTSKIDDNVRYIFILHRVSDDTYTHINEYSVIQPRNINDLQTDQVYKWYAYSYLSTDPIDVPAPGVSSSIPTFYDKALIYASGQFKAVSGQNKIAIVFDHQLTQINVEVNVKKAYADITHIKGEIINGATTIKTGTFDFITGTKANFLSADNEAFDLVFENKTPGDNSVKVAKRYTSDPSLTKFNIRISELIVQYPDGTTEDLTTKIAGFNEIEFKDFQANNSGNMLKGKLNLTFTLPQMKIVTFSNSTDYGYQMDKDNASAHFVRDGYNFGPNSDYVAIDGITISHNYAVTNNEITLLLSNPANYPDILFIANYYAYLNDASWDGVIRYLNAGGKVFYTHDEPANAQAAERGLSLVLGQTVKLQRPNENGGVYLFTNTPAAANDKAILQGPFGDVTNIHWGQDVAGTTYVVGYTGSDAIVYSNHSENFKSPTFTPTSASGMALFRHKTKYFFYAGDGGFLSNPYSNGDAGGSSNWNIYPFRTKGGTGADKNFPIVSMFGRAAASNSPTYYAPHKGASKGTYPMSNSIFFGNVLSWMLEQAYFNPVNRN